MIKKRVVVLSELKHKQLTMEMAKQGRTRKAIVEDALKMYLEFKDSERILNKVER